jgi:dTDP-4-amino-4,6-dideoxygalactose transaminase
MPEQAVEFIDLKAQQRRLRRQINSAIRTVLDHGSYIMGPEIAELERRLCAFTGAKHCISCGSGTDALILAFMALEIGRGDAVLMPSFTFVATAEAAALLGATPVFVDVDRDYFEMDPASLISGIEVARARGLRPRAVVPVDLFGLPADYEAIDAIARANNVVVVADAAQSFGAEAHGRRVGTLAPITTTSFFPAKPLGCYGDGGAVFTDDDDFADRMRSIRIHGKGKDKYDNIRIGLNGRMDTLQAAILIQKLSVFESEIAARNDVAARYARMLKKRVKVPLVRAGTTSVWAQYTVAVPNRERVMQGLSAVGIPSAVYYSIPMHRQTAYRECPVAAGGLPVSDELSRSVLSLPMHAYLKRPVQRRIASTLLSLLE